MNLTRLALLSGLSLFLSTHAFSAEAGTPAAVSNSKGKTIAIVNNEPIFASELEKEAEPFVERYKKTAPDKDKTPEKIAALRKEILMDPPSFINLGKWIQGIKGF